MLVNVSAFFKRCASSQMSRSQLPSLANLSAWMRNVSYDTIITWKMLLGRRNVFIDAITSARELSDNATVRTRPLRNWTESRDTHPHTAPSPPRRRQTLSCVEGRLEKGGRTKRG